MYLNEKSVFRWRIIIEIKCGIYYIKNKINNKIYIGMSKNIKRRFSRHRQKLKDNIHTNKHLQSSWNKYGEKNFKFGIIEECNEGLLVQKEKYWIEKLQTFKSNNGYNKTHGGEFGKLHEDIYKRYSIEYKNNKISEEQKQKISKALIGRKQEAKAIQNRVKSTRKLDDETEALIIKLYIEDNYTRKQIEKELNIRSTLIQSVIKRSKRFKYKNKK